MCGGKSPCSKIYTPVIPLFFTRCVRLGINLDPSVNGKVLAGTKSVLQNRWNHLMRSIQLVINTCLTVTYAIGTLFWDQNIACLKKGLTFLFFFRFRFGSAAGRRFLVRRSFGTIPNGVGHYMMIFAPPIEKKPYIEAPHNLCASTDEGECIRNFLFYLSSKKFHR